MDYLAIYELRYKSSVQIRASFDKCEYPQQFFGAKNDEKARETARELGERIVKITNSTGHNSGATITLEKLLQVIEIPIR